MLLTTPSVTLVASNHLRKATHVLCNPTYFSQPFYSLTLLPSYPYSLSQGAFALSLQHALSKEFNLCASMDVTGGKSKFGTELVYTA